MSFIVYGTSLYTLSVQVLENGAPVTDAYVYFISSDGTIQADTSNLIQARGAVDADGVYAADVLGGVYDVAVKSPSHPVQVLNYAAYVQGLDLTSGPLVYQLDIGAPVEEPVEEPIDPDPPIDDIPPSDPEPEPIIEPVPDEPITGPGDYFTPVEETSGSMLWMWGLALAGIAVLSLIGDKKK